MGSQSRVAIVTGASSGIGLAVARALVAKGGRVALVARSRGPLEEASRELGSDRAVPFPLDVRDRTAVVALPGRVVERFGRLDLVVHSAGMNHRGPFLERSFEELPDLVFSQPMSTAASVAGAVLRAIETRRGEIDVPRLSGMLATLGYLSPRLFVALRPLLEKRGARNKRRFLSRRGAPT
jgi:NAD(P)-dependent dehydrogenase (short-subunit alcohol dehydrogenase family)